MTSEDMTEYVQLQDSVLNTCRHVVLKHVEFIQSPCGTRRSKNGSNVLVVFHQILSFGLVIRTPLLSITQEVAAGVSRSCVLMGAALPD